MRSLGSGELAGEIAAFDAEVPIEAARTPPSTWYRCTDFLELEARTVFRRNWIAAGRADQVAEPGRYFTGRLLGESFVVLRDADGDLRALHNVCRHHGAEICSGEGKVRSLVCPYHAWTYDLAGRLQRAPGMPEDSWNDTEIPRLPAIRVGELGPLVLLDFGGDAAPLEAALAPLTRHHPAQELSALSFVRRRTYQLRCNWKVYVENYLDGGYHVAHLHRSLAGQLDVASYRTEIHPRLALQLCTGRSTPGRTVGEDFRERIGGGAVYAWLHPNLMLNRYGPVLDVNVVLPLGPDRCEVVFDYWFEPAAATGDPGFIDRCLEASDRVQREDEAICESVQRGMSSSSYDRGLYNPVIEPALHHFHRLLSADLRAGFATPPGGDPGCAPHSSESR